MHRDDRVDRGMHMEDVDLTIAIVERQVEPIVWRRRGDSIEHCVGQIEAYYSYIHMIIRREEREMYW